MNKKNQFIAENVKKRKFSVLNLPSMTHFSLKYFNQNLIVGRVDSQIYFYCMKTHQILKSITNFNLNHNTMNIEIYQNYAYVNRGYSFSFIDLNKFEEICFQNKRIGCNDKIYKDMKSFEKNGTFYFLFLNDEANKIVLYSGFLKENKFKELNVSNELFDSKMNDKFKNIFANLDKIEEPELSEHAFFEYETDFKEVSKRVDNLVSLEKAIINLNPKEKHVSNKAKKNLQIQNCLSVSFVNLPEKINLKRKDFEKNVDWKKEIENLQNKNKLQINKLESVCASLKTKNKELNYNFKKYFVNLKKKEEHKNQKLTKSINTLLEQKDSKFRQEIINAEEKYTIQIDLLQKKMEKLQLQNSNLEKKLKENDLQLQKLKIYIQTYKAKVGIIMKDNINNCKKNTTFLKTKSTTEENSLKQTINKEHTTNISEEEVSKYKQIIYNLQNQLNFYKNKNAGRSISPKIQSKRQIKSVIKKNKKIQKSLFQDLKYLKELISENKNNEQRLINFQL